MFQEWAHHPGTLALKAVLRKQVLEAQGHWARGAYLQDKVQEAGVLGQINAYNTLIELEWEDLEGELKDVEG